MKITTENKSVGYTIFFHVSKVKGLFVQAELGLPFSKRHMDVFRPVDQHTIVLPFKQDSYPKAVPIFEGEFRTKIGAASAAKRI